MASAQGVVETTPGLGFDSRSVEVAFEAGVPAPTLQLRLGFGTDEIASAGVIPDAFSLTVQETGSTPRTFLLATFDSGGVVWAPPTPGIEALPSDNLLWAPITAPPELAGLGQVHSYYLEVLLPPTIAGRPLQVHFDLFNNDNGVSSRGWYSAVEAVPEPSIVGLLAVGLLALGWARRFAKPVRELGRTLSVLAGWGWLALTLALAVAGGAGTVHAQDKTFRLYGTDLVLGERTADVEVFYRSMRFNRALNVWNVEVVVTNTSGRALKGPLILLVDSVDGSSGVVGPDGVEDSQPAKSFFDLSAAAGDGVLSAGESTVARTLTLGPRANEPPTLRTKFYAGRDPVVAALGVTRSLDASGRPLPEVAVTLSGPVTTAQQSSDRDSGVISFGQGPGEHRLRFDRQGYLPVWRRLTLAPEAPRVLPNPRLTSRSVSPVGITPLGGQVVSNASGSVEIEFSAGAVREAGPVTLTSLTGQTLPAFLPLGWSPLSAFWIESAVPFGTGVRAGLVPEGGARAGESLVLVRWNEAPMQWEVSALVSGDGTNRVFAPLERPGAYALVVADAGVAVPALAPSQPLPALAVPIPDVAGLTARGTVQPAASPASLDPEQVTGQARLEVRHAGARLPSGWLLRGEVTETYLLKDGSLRLTPQYEHFVVGYQRPGDADPNTLHATFPMRPQLLFGPDQLETASVQVDLLPEQPFDGQVMDATGGQIGVQGVRVVAGGGQLTGPSAIRLRRLDGQVFEKLMTSSNAVVGAFELTVDASTVGDALAARLGGAPGNSRFVLARVLSDVGFYGLQPVERLVSDAAGNLSSAEPATGERLPGLRGSGQFVLVQVDAPQALVSGVARNGAGQVQGRMPVSLVGLPWLALTDDQGRYQLVGPAGDRELSVRDPGTGDAGVVAVRIEDGGATVSQDLGTAPAGPRVARITPANDATRVPRVGSVVIEFNEALNPATVVGPAIQLIRPDDSVVPTALTLNLKGTVATLSPATELDANTTYRVRLAATIADPTGLPLEGASEFRFTTVPASARIATAQLIIYEPGATNVPAAILDDIPAFTPGQDPSAIVVHGQPGVADPGVPVILVNESTGETQTVLSQPDGSFSSFISGAEEDFVSATFVNLNGTRVYVPVSRQEFDDGFVGLYPQGGILEAQSDGGPVQILIQPNAVPNRTKFRARTLNVSQLLRETGGVSPDLATIAGGGMKIEVEGQPPTLPMQLSFPVDLAQLGYPQTEDPTNAAAALAVVRDLQGVKTYEVVDQLIFEPTVTAPSVLTRVRRADLGTATGGVLHTLAGFAPGLIQFAPMVYDFIVVPLVLGARPVVVTGKAVQAVLDQSGGAADNFVFNEINAAMNGQALPGAFVILRNTPPIGPPGRLQPGMVHATSGPDGMFLMMAPAANAGYILTGTHPRYTTRINLPVIPYLDIEFSGYIRKNLVFRDPVGADAPLRLNVAHTPQFPAPEQECEVQVSAFRGSGTIPDILVTVASVTNLFGDDPARFEDVTLTNLSSVNSGTSRLWRGMVKASKPVQAVLKITADGEITTYPIDFTGTIPPVIGGPLPKPDTNDVHGPIVISTMPSVGGYLGISGEITIQFNKPIDRTIEQARSGIGLDGPLTSAQPVIRLNGAQNTLTLQYSGLEPDREYTLTLTGEAVRDLAGQPLDQRPSTPEPDSFRFSFRSPVVRNVTLPEMVNGRGSAISGQNLYVIESTPQGSSLIVFDISNPGLPSVRARSRLLGQPRDLVVIPSYAFRLNPEDPIQTNELVAVVGGDLETVVDRIGNVTVKGQYLTLFSMENPSAPRQLASPILSYRVGASVTKVEWSPPNLIYHEFGPDIQLLGVVNVQEMIVGFGDLGWGGRQWFEWFGEEGRPGTDSNRDGDYVDPGELLPIPPYPPIEFFGKKQNYAIGGTTQKILDFSPVSGGDLIGITLTRGLARDLQGQLGQRYSPSYRTLALNLDVGNPEDSVFEFGDLAYPRWVTVLESLPILSNGVPIMPPVALVSLQPDEDGMQKLAILDITLPRTPRLINSLPIPEEILGGAIQSIRQRADGLLEISGGKNLVLLDPQWLAVTNVPIGQAHPAMVGFIAAAGAGTRSVGATDFGYHSVAEGGRGALIQTAPRMRFVHFPGSTFVVDPAGLKSLEPDELTALARSARVRSAIPPARAKGNKQLEIGSDLDPPRPSAHFHVWVEAPGTSGKTIELGLESVNHAGTPLSNLGLGFAPVRALSESAQEAIGQKPRSGCGAPIRSLTAWRMSDDPASPFFNRYLSRPFALVANESLTLSDLQSLRTGVDREILYSAAGLRVFIDPSESENRVLGPFAARVDDRRKLLVPVAGMQAIAQFHPYVMGDNPPPPGGHLTMPGTFGMVASHSGEVRTESVDLVLPSPRMPISIQRSIGNQDSYEGPFGVGWDFNYNQRLSELDPLSFPLGLQMPVVARSTRHNSTIAGSQDVLFSTGMGKVIVFKWVGTNLPPEYSGDPLVKQFGYADSVSDYYLPARGQGIFDLLVKFRSGIFERLTPDGVRCRYTADGRLESVIDRFPKNRHVLEYDRSGWLVRIDDRSVTADRYVEFGRYRAPSDPDFKEGLDDSTDNAYLVGKICRLRDYSGRDVLFFYSDDGFLIRREGAMVSGGTGGFTGRPQTHYTYQSCRLVGIGAGSQGDPLFSADPASGTDEKFVAGSGNGTAGAIDFDIPAQNSAAGLAGQKSTAIQAESRQTELRFDERGHPTSIRLTGGGGEDVETQTGVDEEGRVTSIRYPEGRRESRVYDVTNPVFRSRGNLISVVVDPGPRGGEKFTETRAYDPRYNLPIGDQVDANGYAHTFILRSDGLEVTSIQHGEAGTETVSHDDHGQVLFRRDIRGVEMANEYESASGFVRLTRSGESETRFGYDGSQAARLGQPTLITPPVGDPIKLTRNANLQLIRASRGSSVMEWSYDERGRTVESREELSDGRIRRRHLDYDANGFLVRDRTDGVEVNGAPSAFEYVYTPDRFARVRSIRFPNGTTQEIEYNLQGHVAKITLGSYVEEFLRDRHGNVVSVKKGGDEVEAVEYDGLDRPTRTTRRTGTHDESILNSYYPGGQSRTLSHEDPRYGTASSVEVGAIDELGRPLRVTLKGAEISPTTEFQYRPLESVVMGPRMEVRSTWNAAGHALRIENPILTRVLHPDGGNRVQQLDSVEDGAVYKQFMEYDGLDHITVLKDLVGVQATYAPRSDGKNTSVENARGHRTTLEHSLLGEPLVRRREDGMEVRRTYDANRQVQFTGDPDGGFRYSYDGQFRLVERTLRNKQSIRYEQFDARERPTRTVIPGGSIETRYDFQGRTVSRTVSFQGTTHQCEYDYDALSRVRVVNYRQDNSPECRMQYDFDPSGVLLGIRSAEMGAEYSVRFNYYADGKRRSVTYPSGVTVTEDRDVSGRLLGISDSSGSIARVTAWQGNSQPKTVELGAGIEVVNQYDPRGRMTASRAVQKETGKVLTHVRTRFDLADNVEVQQFLHRGGLANFLTYDRGERISQARVGVAANSEGATSRMLYSRTYAYDTVGRDFLASAPIGSGREYAPAFATNWSGHDDFLLPTVVDGYTRGGGDPMGRVAKAELRRRVEGSAEPEAAAANIVHNGRGDLVRVEFGDGTVVENLYQPGGLRFMRRVTRGGQVVETRHFVYDEQSRLIEEYDRTEEPALLVARYYYGNADFPLAADVLNQTRSGLNRVYFLSDVSGSTMGIADSSGRVIERVWYDPFGQPVIETEDDQSPVLRGIRSDEDGRLLISLSETVLASFADPGAGEGIVAVPAIAVDSLVSVSVGSETVPGTVELLPEHPGAPPYSVIRFTPSTPIPSTSVGMIGWWPGDSQASEVVGGNNGTLRGGATVADGIHQQAFVLGRSGGFVEITNAAAVNLGLGDFTISTWVIFNSVAGEQVILEKWSADSSVGWSFVKDANQRLRFVLSDGSGQPTVVESRALGLREDAWLQVALRREAGQVSILTNGVVVASGSAMGSMNSPATFKFGSRAGIGSFLTGRLDEITVYGRALNDAELSAIAGGVTAPGPVKVTVSAGGVMDEWGNVGSGAEVAFGAVGAPNVVYYSAQPSPETAASRVGRSAVGVPFLFHGQYFDYESGLLYLRARYYDSFSGMFLEPDPLGYEESVNPYAGMRNNPTSRRDPSGLISIPGAGVFKMAADAVKKLLKKEEEIVETGAEVLEVMNLVDAPAEAAIKTETFDGRWFFWRRPLLDGVKPEQLAGSTLAFRIQEIHPLDHPFWDADAFDLAAFKATSEVRSYPRTVWARGGEGIKPVKYKGKALEPGYKNETILGKGLDPKRAVKYSDDAERLTMKVTVQNGRLVNADGNLLDTTDILKSSHGNEGAAMFVMDVHGGIYVSKFQEAGYYHHSSIIEGLDVGAAGELVVEKGVIKMISNKSGHYKPTEEHIKQFVSELSERGVDTSGFDAITKIYTK